MWNIHSRKGFLPFDPIERLHPATPGGDVIEETAKNLPFFVANKTVRKDLVAALSYDNGIHYTGPLLTKLTLGDLFNNCIDSPQQAERAMMLYSYFASSYIHAPGEEPVKVLPKEIAVPLQKLAKIVGRPPILSYASYCLYNWKRIDPKKPIELGNIELLQNFTLSEGRRDENWFILVHVDIEAKASRAIWAINDHMYIPRERLEKETEGFAENPWSSIGGTWSDEMAAITGNTQMFFCPAGIEHLMYMFEDISYSLGKMYETLCRMPEECSTDVYYSQVRPYIFSYENIVYEQDPWYWQISGDGKPMTYRGETGAQSSCIPAIQLALGVKHKDSLLTQHLKDMRNYMPPAHRQWLAILEEHGGFRQIAKNIGYEKQYNECIERLIAFRSKHLEYAINYIQKKVTNPVGTGGTPYIQWLSNLVDETKEYMF
jgi:indoleamine 2,3-dioxygenase